MLNEVVLIGRLGKEPEVRETSNGTKVATILLPLYHAYSPEGKKTEWVQCDAFGKLANVVELAKKGVMVTVRGELNVQSWEDENGNYRSRTFVKIDSFRFLEKKKKEEDSIGETTTNDTVVISAEKLDDIDEFLGSF